MPLDQGNYSEESAATAMQLLSDGTGIMATGSDSDLSFIDFDGNRECAKGTWGDHGDKPG